MSVDETMLNVGRVLGSVNANVNEDLPIRKRGILVADCASQSVVTAVVVDCC